MKQPRMLRLGKVAKHPDCVYFFQIASLQQSPYLSLWFLTRVMLLHDTNQLHDMGRFVSDPDQDYNHQPLGQFI